MLQFAERMNSIKPNVMGELFKLLANPEIISFGGGNPANDSFPVQLIDTMTHELMQEKGARLLQYGVTEGYPPLIESYIQHIAEPKGLHISSENVIVTSGALQGLDLILKLFLNPGEVVLCENPSFAGSLQAIRVAQGKLVPVPMDDEGVMIDELEAKIKEHKPKIFYCIPTFQNPSGRTLGAERRKAIAELAAKYDILVVEDDPYCDLRYSGEPQPCIKSFDTTDNVILLNSFSKIFSPGLRVGTMVAAKEVITKAASVKLCSDTHTANLNQALVDLFLRGGHLPGHLAKIIPPYARKLNTMVESLEKFFPAECKFVKPEGGLFIWVELPKEINMMEMFSRAIKEQKVAFVPGGGFCVDDPAMGRRCLRLNFSNASPELIPVGVERLAGLLKEYL